MRDKGRGNHPVGEDPPLNNDHRQSNGRIDRVGHRRENIRHECDSLHRCRDKHHPESTDESDHQCRSDDIESATFLKFIKMKIHGFERASREMK